MAGLKVVPHPPGEGENSLVGPHHSGLIPIANDNLSIVAAGSGA